MLCIVLETLEYSLVKLATQLPFSRIGISVDDEWYFGVGLLEVVKQMNEFSVDNNGFGI